MAKRKRYYKSFWGVALIFVVVGCVAFFGFQFFTKTGLFRVPGVVHYDDSLRENELRTLEDIFIKDVVLDSDVTIFANESPSRPDLSENQFLYQIYVPVTDFYEVRTDTNELSDAEFKFIPIEELNFDKKLLAIDGEYFLDSFDAGAIFRVLTFDSKSYSDEIKPLVEKYFSKKFPNKDNVLTFAQSGVTALSRAMNTKINQVNDGKYFSTNISDFLSSFDLTHTSNESSFTDLANSNNICTDPRFKDTLLDVGLDIVELTGNHNLDCGANAAIETLDWYEKNNIKVVGGGRNKEEAAKPLSLNEKDNNITIFAYNQSTGGATLGDDPGANQYHEDLASAEIAEAKERGDIVIVDVQYYECSAYVAEYEDPTCDAANSAAGDQIGFFRHLIDLGADVVVGTSAHQPQTFELYNGGAIYYGLGNLFFDQSWWPGTTRSLILGHYLYDNKLLQTKVIPTVYDDGFQTKLADEEVSRWFLQRLINARP